jgi:DNA gyrase/topoisomerase IV subunit A
MIKQVSVQALIREIRQRVAQEEDIVEVIKKELRKEKNNFGENGHNALKTLGQNPVNNS